MVSASLFFFTPRLLKYENTVRTQTTTGISSKKKQISRCDDVTFCRTVPRLRSGPVKWWSYEGRNFPGTLSQNKSTTVVDKADLCSVKSMTGIILPHVCATVFHSDLITLICFNQWKGYMCVIIMRDVCVIHLNVDIVWEQNNNKNRIVCECMDMVSTVIQQQSLNSFYISSECRDRNVFLQSVPQNV